jgi:hypothetical protein
MVSEHMEFDKTDMFGFRMPADGDDVMRVKELKPGPDVRKYLDYQDKTNPFDCLWENHLKGLLFEYLRGNRRAKELLEKLHDAYNKKSLNE